MRLKYTTAGQVDVLDWGRKAAERDDQGGEHESVRKSGPGHVQQVAHVPAGAPVAERQDARPLHAGQLLPRHQALDGGSQEAHGLCGWERPVRALSPRSVP